MLYITKGIDHSTINSFRVEDDGNKLRIDSTQLLKTNSISENITIMARSLIMQLTISSVTT